MLHPARRAVLLVELAQRPPLSPTAVRVEAGEVRVSRFVALLAFLDEHQTPTAFPATAAEVRVARRKIQEARRGVSRSEGNSIHSSRSPTSNEETRKTEVPVASRFRFRVSPGPVSSARVYVSARPVEEQRPSWTAQKIRENHEFRALANRRNSTEISDLIFCGRPEGEKAPFALSARIALGFGVRSRRATGTAPKASARRPSRTRPRRDPRLERGRGTWRPRCRARCPRTRLR